MEPGFTKQCSITDTFIALYMSYVLLMIKTISNW